jgi:acyl carrier protein
MTRSSIGDQLVAAGAALMAPEHAFAALGRALMADRPRYLIAAITWSRFLAGFGESVPGFFAAVAPAKQRTTSRAIAGGDPRASVAALRGFVTAAASAVLGAGPNETPDPDIPLNESGLDSLMALELRKSLGNGLDLRLPATLLFNFPTINALTEHLAGLIGLSQTSEEAPDATPPPVPIAIPQEQIVESVMRMSEDEMAEAIAQEFALTVAANG